MEGQSGRGPVPPRSLHLLEAHGALSRASHFRRPEWRLRLRPAREVEHAAPGADHAKRRRVPRGRQALALRVAREGGSTHRSRAAAAPAVAKAAPATRIKAYEMAFRMQTSGPELMDLSKASKASKATLELYGVEPGKPGYALNCLLARRLVERGVRLVQLFHEAWDHHAEVHKGVKDQAATTDKANAALIKDIKQRGLLEDTLVIWGGEFGRTPMVQHDPNGGYNQGRDHHPQAFTMWMAGGGVKPGVTIGETDELGFHVVRDKVHVHDLHATILHLLGFDHTRLTFRFQARDFRLTDVHGELVKAMVG